MNRWSSLSFPRFALHPRHGLATALLALGLAVGAQTPVREFPKDALRGTLVVLVAPAITMDGNPDRLSPGARIRDAQNMLVMTGALQGQEWVVNYTRENSGLVHQVWILTPQEAVQKRMGSQAQRNYNLAADPKPDLQVPFDQLPKYQP
jgi:hypothetical protein